MNMFMMIFLLYLMSSMIFMIMYNHLLITLMSLELMMLSLLLFMFKILMIMNIEFMLMYYLIIIVCEGVLGLSILIIMIRYKGFDKLNLINLMMW